MRTIRARGCSGMLSRRRSKSGASVSMPFDPRGVANLILDAADNRLVSLSNLALQKVLYFVHGKFLIEERSPLIAGSFEAWQFGPVNLPVYESFKSFGARAIGSRATKRDIRTGEVSIAQLPADQNVRRKIAEVAAPFLTMNAGRLVELSHATNSPWDRITRNPEGGRSYGLRISNENILENFRYHKIAIREHPPLGEPDEESTPY